ncbi:MAG TPA: bifunctional D-glycero-beta-D-manno-heptose-7-phosphate kinase/D-glycero-beta-D-manno-heptose 1-phosphate adenylyltransferase HldE [Chromatiaceae bacterium]|nr:bifunctional D-glycero-beta-D-manno-heptose-7-phosphate kinase/D-glycero-beta-D-manno-heptose 1-phosphate adenylyltransferase HldE [Chromatiaceae bacterium]
MQEQLDFSQARVLVVGDLMLDRYWHGGAERISPEAPVPVVKVEDEEARAGGSGNVALNIAALGGRVSLLALSGEDEAADQLDRLLRGQGVETHLLRDGRHRTISKLRILSRHQQLIRLDFEDPFPASASALLAERFATLLDEADVVVLSDYAKGTLSDCGTLIRQTRAAGKPVLVDPKGDDFSRYRGATLITPNQGEFGRVKGVHGDDESCDRAARELKQALDLEALLVTRGEHGMLLLDAGDTILRLPTEAREVFDVTGAGDTVIAALATALAAGWPLDQATRLANLAAGIVVAKLGTATASVAELRRAIHQRGTPVRGVVDEEQLMRAVDAARANGETIVMTNGCFDILHAGHVTYLQQAAALGDRFIVAVNVDETVRRLKGADRPVNDLQRRMTVLAALGCVDWVVPFSEETPERLICRVLPDYLTKGGDNDPERIPGARCVREAGGQVRIMSYLDNCSTTGTIQSIREKGAGHGD